MCGSPTISAAGRRDSICCGMTSICLMLPSVRPMRSSMSSGVSRVQSMIASLKFGAYLVSSSMSHSPNGRRISSQEPSRMCGGTKKTHIDRTWPPSGAIVGSYTVGIWTWMIGVSGTRPFLESFQLRSGCSTEGQRLIIARCSGL